MSSRETVGARIRRLRIARGMSKSELARRSDVSPTAVNNWEKWQIGPRSDVLPAIAKALGTTVGALRGEVAAGGVSPAGSEAREEALSDLKARIAALLGVATERVRIYIDI